ncbi:MAG: hypothetical protein ABI347_00090 [Nitrososphaera sp.]|jgi:hypothetical protein
MGAKESAVAKSTGLQDREDALPGDHALYNVLSSKKKVSKKEAQYRLQRGKSFTQSCVKCKFNLGDERKCHVVAGLINNEQGISKFFSPKGDGMLPGDVVWELVKDTGTKLAYREGHIISKGAKGFQCRDCKYYLYSRNCLLIKGTFKPEMSCGYIVRIGNGTKI